MELEDTLAALNFTMICDNIRRSMFFEDLARGASSPDRAQKLLHFSGLMLAHVDDLLPRIS